MAEVDLKGFSKKIQIFEAYCGRLPTDEEGLDVLVHQPTDSARMKWFQLMEKIPSDPWGHPYRYRLLTGSGPKFEVLSLGPDGVESADDIRLTHSEEVRPSH